MQCVANYVLESWAGQSRGFTKSNKGHVSDLSYYPLYSRKPRMYVLQGHRTVRSRNTYSYDTNTVLHRGNIIPHETHFFSFLNSPRFFYPVGAVHCRPRLSVAARPTLCGYSIGQCRWVSSVIVIIIALVDKGIYSIIWDPDRCLVASRLEKSKTCCLSPAVDMLFSEISSKKVPYSPTAKKKKTTITTLHTIGAKLDRILNHGSRWNGIPFSPT